jgi:hypothetical protein
MNQILVGSIYGGSSILAKQFQRRFLEIDQPEKRIAYGNHVCKRIGMNLAVYRGPSIDASYQVLIHLAKQFQRRRFFRNQPIRNKNAWPNKSKFGRKHP